jgi:quinol---cytochrome c reductase iron-sulfur subunit, bacillus type
MSSTERPTRRRIFFMVGTILNAAAAFAIGIPVLRYLFSPKIRERRPGYDSWVPLGPVSTFPTGETRFATFRNPVQETSDGDTAKVSCWVRNIDGRQFQIFAINCAHLGCPVRWFPQSNLFMCPCHGGAYYADGARASGPPERGLFEYRYKIEGDTLYIEAGQMPTPGSPLATLRVRRSTCA